MRFIPGRIALLVLPLALLLCVGRAGADSDFNVNKALREYIRAHKYSEKTRKPENPADFKLHESPDEKLDALIRRVHKKVPDFIQRVEIFSEAQLGIPFQWGPLGEGSDGAFDSHSTISFKTVDCVTYVEQTMAMAMAPDLSSATAVLQKIRYKNGEILFKTRNHFSSVDWIPNNVAAGYLKDITADVAGEDVRIATKTINKAVWYSEMKGKNLEGPDVAGLPETLKKKLVKAMHQVGQGLPEVLAELPYLRADRIPEHFREIPSGTIISVIREVKEDIPVLVSHQGLFIRKGREGAAYFRHAAINGKVIDAPFLEYFYRYFDTPWPILGLNLTFPLQPE